MSTFQPAPTWAPVTVTDPLTGEDSFNPVWLKWFIDVAAFITANGGGGAIDLVTVSGIVARIAASTYAARVITGTASQVSVANGDGVAGDPTIDIAPHLAAADPHTQYALDTDLVAYVLKSLFSAKGSILGASAASTPANLSVGTDGQILTADSAQAIGIKWSDPVSTGNWTPVLTFATPGNLSVTYSVQTGSWLKIGKILVASFQIATSAFTYTTASGALNITGLPNASASPANILMFGGSQWGGITKAGYTDLNWRITSGASLLLLVASGSGNAATTVLASDMPSGGTPALLGTIVYQIA